MNRLASKCPVNSTQKTEMDRRSVSCYVQRNLKRLFITPKLPKADLKGNCRRAKAIHCITRKSGLTIWPGGDGSAVLGQRKSGSRLRRRVGPAVDRHVCSRFVLNRFCAFFPGSAAPTD